jgi:hypothetical protein
MPGGKGSVRRVTLSGLPGCQTKWWECYWLCSSFSIGRIVALPQGHNRNSRGLHHRRRFGSTPQTLTHCCFWPAVRNRIRPDTWHCCIALQVLYIWQHQSRILWIPPHKLSVQEHWALKSGPESTISHGVGGGVESGLSRIAIGRFFIC